MYYKIEYESSLVQKHFNKNFYFWIPAIFPNKLKLIT